MKRESIIQIIVIVILTTILGILIYLNIEEINKKEEVKEPDNRFEMREESKEKETKESDIEKGEEVSEKEIDLSKYDNNITINKGGTYTLTGEFEHSVLIDSENEVTLILDNVTIENENTASIANISENDLTIKLEENTENNLSDGGSSEYDSCIYSKGKEISMESP